MLELLIAVSWRSLALAALAGVAMARVKSPAIRHAVWSLVTGGMLAMAIAIVALPAVPVRVLRPATPPAPLPTTATLFVPAIRVVPSLPAPPFPWAVLFAALYGAGLAILAGRLAYGYRLTCTLVRGAQRIARFEEEGIYEAAYICVPMTVGWLRPKILLPADWQTWDAAKLDAVLVHERNHVRRADWAIAVLAAVNRCMFWFHPLAWWLEARLKALAEEACDDASLAHLSSPVFYAQVLVEMAAAVQSGEGRVGSGALAMAKGEVRMRIERILDEGRRIGRPMTRARWAAMAVCAIPVVYLSAVARPARVRAQDPPPAAATPVAPAAQDNGALQAARQEVERVEKQITTFKSDNMGRLPEQFQANVMQLNSLQMMLAQSSEALSRLQQERLKLETQLQNLNTQSRYYGSYNELAEKLAGTRIRDLQSQLAAARETLTADHPNVRRLEVLLAEAEKERSELAATGTQQNKKMVLDLEGATNTVKTEMQNLNLQMDEKVKALSELQRSIAAYQQRIETSPKMESQYADLMRKLEIARQQTAELENTRRTVQLSVTFDADGRPQKIRVARSLGLAQDEKAIEWAKSLRFVPSSPDAAVVIIEVPANRDH